MNLRKKILLVSFPFPVFCIPFFKGGEYSLKVDVLCLF